MSFFESVKFTESGDREKELVRTSCEWDFKIKIPEIDSQSLHKIRFPKVVNSPCISFIVGSKRYRVV